MHYRDLINADGSVNLRAHAVITAARATAEINLALVIDAGLRCPAHVPFRDTRDWYAQAAAKLNPGNLSPRERRRIWERARADVRDIINSMLSVRAEIAAHKAA